ncbi:MAG TPA: helix-turn-helix domain-containing protein [Candidatus Acidoferrum sp.]|jgi:excisionase family DNA binding protein|nr:helix-turn-helix domain-containing protein [Candidatus Acidoferrum sp.]
MEEFLTPDEAAARLRISVATLRFLRQRGKFAPATKIGRRLFWDPADLELWLKQQKETA